MIKEGLCVLNKQLLSVLNGRVAGWQTIRLPRWKFSSTRPSYQLDPGCISPFSFSRMNFSWTVRNNKFFSKKTAHVPFCYRVRRDPPNRNDNNAMGWFTEKKKRSCANGIIVTMAPETLPGIERTGDIGRRASFQLRNTLVTEVLRRARGREDDNGRCHMNIDEARELPVYRPQWQRKHTMFLLGGFGAR